MSPDITFRVAFWITIGLMFLVRGFFAMRVKRQGERLMPDKAAIEREGRGSFVARFIGFFVLLGLLGLYAVNPPWFRVMAVPLPAWLRWTGFGIGLLGIALVAWTEVALGRHWSAQLQLRQEHRLVTDGPYARVRHPHYSAITGFGVGVALVSASWPFIVMLPVILWGLVDRIPKEEKMLAGEFGEAWQAYARKTRRLIPWIW